DPLHQVLDGRDVLEVDVAGGRRRGGRLPGRRRGLGPLRRRLPGPGLPLAALAQDLPLGAGPLVERHLQAELSLHEILESCRRCATSVPRAARTASWLLGVLFFPWPVLWLAPAAGVAALWVFFFAMGCSRG